MYNFFGYFLLVYIIVLGLIIGWFILQVREENRLMQSSIKKDVE